MRLTRFFLIGSAFMDIVFSGDRSRCVAVVFRVIRSIQRFQWRWRSGLSDFFALFH